jgi:hypothetical protein
MAKNKTESLPKKLRVTVGGRYWALSFPKSMPRSMWGFTDDPKQKRKSIKVKRTLRPDQFLDTLIHELLHAAEWDANEEWVDKIGTHTAQILILAGWGRQNTNGSISELTKLILACLRLSKLYLDHDDWAVRTSQDIAKILWKLGWRL